MPNRPLLAIHPLRHSWYVRDSREAKEYADDKGGGVYPNRSPHDKKGTIEGQRPMGSLEFPPPLYSLLSFSTLGLIPLVPTLTLSPPPDMMESSADGEG